MDFKNDLLNKDIITLLMWVRYIEFFRFALGGLLLASYFFQYVFLEELLIISVIVLLFLPTNFLESLFEKTLDKKIAQERKRKDHKG